MFVNVNVLRVVTLWSVPVIDRYPQSRFYTTAGARERDRRRDSPHTKTSTALLSVTGDLDGDGTDDALVAVDDIYDGCGDQGSYRTTRLLAYAVKDGAATRVLGARRATDAPITIAGRGVVRTHPGGCVERWELVGPGLAQIGAPCR